MNLQELKKRYYKTESEALAKSLSANAGGSVLAINGVKGSAQAFIAAQISEEITDTEALNIILGRTDNGQSNSITLPQDD